MIELFIDFANTFVYVYLVPGMTIALGLCFFFIAIPQCQSLECYKRSRFLMGITFVVYGLAIILEQITLKGSSSSGVLARLIIIAISVSQAFMFTSTLVTLVDISYLTVRRIAAEGLVLLALVVSAFHVAGLGSRWADGVLCAMVAGYIVLLVRYVRLFRRRYAAYVRCMDNYFSDDETKRLQWVSRSFYCSLAVGVLALLYSFKPSALTCLVFMSVVAIYYTTFGIRFINYAFTFSLYKEAIEDAASECQNGQPAQEADTSVLSDNAGETKGAASAAPEDEQLMRDIDELMQRELLYKNPGLTAAVVAARLSKNHRMVSEVISRCHASNFKSYVNEMRIAEAVRLLADGWLHDHTIDALAEECGFCNRITFYRVFKRIKGVAPTEFMVTESAERN